MTLKHGPTVRDEAIALACALESRGHALTAADGALRVSNGSGLSLDDRAAIVREKLQLVSIAEYVVSGACDANR